MTPHELLNRLRADGVSIARAGKHLRIVAPKGRLTDRICQEIVARKQELMDLLLSIDIRKANRLMNEQGFIPVQVDAFDGEVILIMRDELVRAPERWRKSVTYTLTELRMMIGLDLDSLCQIHELKRTFGGRVVGRDNKTNDLRSMMRSACE